MPKSFLKEDFKLLLNIPDLSKKYQVSQQSIAIKIQTDRLV
jgi:Mor family transcriptional regulator